MIAAAYWFHDITSLQIVEGLINEANIVFILDDSIDIDIWNPYKTVLKT